MGTTAQKLAYLQESKEALVTSLTNKLNGFITFDASKEKFRNLCTKYIDAIGITDSIPDSLFQNCSGLTSIIIPNDVTSINEGAFSGCASLQSITIPFVGGSKKTASDTYQYPFGYIFGTNSYTGGTAIQQNYYGSSTSSTTNSTYYVPSSLSSVTITGGDIL